MGMGEGHLVEIQQGSKGEAMNVEKPLMTRQEVMDLLTGKTGPEDYGLKPTRPKPESKPAPKPVVVRLITAREFCVEVQRERTLRELKALGRAERRATEGGKAVGGTVLYYRRADEVLGDAHGWALKRVGGRG
jgi:hypothetical protein